ncbi:MAG: glycosyltransferase family 4 protein [Acidobacteriota bacterium]
MKRRLLGKISGLALRVHKKLDQVLRISPNFKPYFLSVRPFPIEGIDRKKITHLIGNFIVGGSSQLVVDLIEKTSDKYSHQIIVPRKPDPLPYQPVDIHEFTINQMAELYDHLKREAPEIVHMHYFSRDCEKFESIAIWYQTVSRICDELNLRVIQNVNVPTTPLRGKSIVHNVFVSHYVRREFDRSEIESSVIYPGSDFSHFGNSKPEDLPDKTIGMVYRLESDKLRAESIEVFISAVKMNPRINVYIVGGGSLLDLYKQRVAEEGLSKNFSFTGYVAYANLPQHYRMMSLFVAPVFDESFGQVTPFAMSMGLCVAGYDTGALSEILGNDATLVKTGDATGLAEKIVDLVASADKRRDLGERNTERAISMFSVEKMIGDYRQLYERYIK